jgi:hypothetical protein
MPLGFEITTTSGSSRAYAGAKDLRRMQAAVARALDTTSLRVGDLAWLTSNHTHRELSLDIRLWESSHGEPFFRWGGEFIVFVAPPGTRTTNCSTRCF